MLFDIAGILINFTGVNDYFVQRSSVFIEERKDVSADDIDMSISLEIVDNIQIPEGELIYEELSKWFKKKHPEQGYYLLFKHRLNDSVATILDTDAEWKNISIKYIPFNLPFHIKDSDTYIQWNIYHACQLIGISFRNYLISMSGIQIHSSSFSVDGKGVIVSAPSGTGKSTHTRLWKELYGDRVTLINDDRPAIRFIDNVPMLCGTPWSGSTDVFCNMKVPLNCIVMLERSPENSIERLDMNRALQLLMPRCFLPYYDQEMMNKAMITLENLVGVIPIYLLKCRPDYEAVELVRKCMS